MDIESPIKIKDDWEYSAVDSDDYSVTGLDDYNVAEPETTLGTIAKSKIITFPIRARYTNWDPREAFRELLQNWRDAMIRFCNVTEQDFCVIREEKMSGQDFEIVYKALHTQLLEGQKKAECVGYIRFSGSNDEGMIDICNRRATLQPEHLDLGATTKADDTNQAGAHGEGLKIALLILMRSPQNHSVRCRAGGFMWTFDFTNRRRLVACLNRMASKTIRATKNQATELINSGSLLPFVANPEEDVQFIIGEIREGRDEKGHKTSRVPVSRDDFDRWTRAALFLRDIHDGMLISTKQGDLLLEPQLRGSIYLKGLLLAESRRGRVASITNRPLRFGYNFASGRTNRERQSLSSAEEESRAIFAIWNEVLAERQDMVCELSDMLNDKKNQYADIAGVHSLRMPYVQSQLASHLHSYLLGSTSVRRWYFSPEERSTNLRLDGIIQGLGCEGVELNQPYWDLMHRYGLLQTAEAEEHRRFMVSPLSYMPDNPYAIAVARLLAACLRASSKTRSKTFRFVQAGQLYLSLHLTGDEILVHDRWLDINGVLDGLGLPEDCVMGDVALHAVKVLFSEVLRQLPLGDSLKDSGANPRRLEQIRAEQRLLEYSRLSNISFRQPKSGGEPIVTVKWLANKQKPSTYEIEVQCHRAACLPNLVARVCLAEEATCDKIPCLCPTENSGATCFVKRVRYASGKCYLKIPEEQDQYCVLMRTPQVTDSIVVISEIETVARGSASVSNRQGASFALGPQVRYMNILDFAQDRWYEAKNSEGLKAVIGFVEGERRHPEEPRKRRKM